MKTAAIICEYDPFHNGHAYLIEKARKEHGFDRVICIMSGNFVQRGAPAVCDKYKRAGWALLAGADMVLEIPPMFSTSAAAEFAACAVRIAEAAGIVDALLFGVEEGITLPELQNEAAGGSGIDPLEIKERLRKGMTYPEAVSVSGSSLSSNNILAAEYLRALQNAGSSIRPIAEARIGDRFSAGCPEDAIYTSATAIRRLLSDGGDISPYVPDFVARDPFPVISPDAMSLYLTKALLSEPDLSVFHDVSREIAGRLSGRKNRIMSFTERIADTKTRQYTYARISRALLHIALSLREDEFQSAKEAGYVSYLRILGLRKGSPLPSLLKENAALPVVGRTAQYEDLLKRDIFCDQLYYSLSGSKGEYERSPVILDDHDLR